MKLLKILMMQLLLPMPIQLLQHRKQDVTLVNAVQVLVALQGVISSHQASTINYLCTCLYILYVYKLNKL